MQSRDRRSSRRKPPPGLLASPAAAEWRFGAVARPDPVPTGARLTMDLLAYLDPGSGSMILQILAGGVAAVAVTARLYWNRILKFLRIRKDDDVAEEKRQPDSA